MIRGSPGDQDHQQGKDIENKTVAELPGSIVAVKELDRKDQAGAQPEGGQERFRTFCFKGVKKSRSGKDEGLSPESGDKIREVME